MGRGAELGAAPGGCLGASDVASREPHGWENTWEQFAVGHGEDPGADRALDCPQLLLLHAS